MSFPAHTKIFWTILFFFAAQSLFSAPAERSVSPSQQFIVYGADAAMRGAVSNLAERTKANLLTRLQQRDNWKTPIVINLQFPQANLPDVPSRALHFSQTGAGLKLQLDLVVGADNDAPELQRELLRAILLEMIYRNQPDLAPGTVYVQPPEWLLDGLLAAQPGQDRARLAAAVASLIASDKMISLEEFLRQKFELLDASSRSLYRACALALLELLVDGTNGPKQLARYIDNLSLSSNDPLADLKANFPALAGTDIEKSWQSNVSKLSRSQKYELLTFAETERRLVEVLALKINATNSRRLQHFLTGKISPTEKIFLVRTAEELLLLAASANPAMRPIVTEYQDIAQRIAAGKRNGLRERLTRLSARRARLVARMNDVDDYMNWFEATQSKTKSGVFADYLKTVDEQREAQPRRRDALSVYLDAVELQVQN